MKGLWEDPEVYRWTAAGGAVERLFADFAERNRWLRRLQDPEFLRRKPLLGVSDEDAERVGRLVLAWMRGAWRSLRQRNTAAWDDGGCQRYLFNWVTARVILRHYLHTLVHGRVRGQEGPGEVFRPPPYYLVRGTRVFDFPNERPQREFFEETWEGTRHPAVVVRHFDAGGRLRWYVLVPITSTGQGCPIEWEQGERATRNAAVVDMWTRATEEMLGRHAGKAQHVPPVDCWEGSGGRCDELELEELLAGQLESWEEDELVKHVAYCDGCLLRLQDLAAQGHSGGGGPRRLVTAGSGAWSSGGSLFEAWQEALQRLGRSGVQACTGQVWATRAHAIRYPGHERDGELSAFDLGSVPRAVVVLEVKGEVGRFRELRVAPTSLALEMAMEDQGDVVVEAGESPLGVPFVVEVWNEQSMLAENLDRCLGQLPDVVMDRILRVRGRFEAVSYEEVVRQGLDGDARWRFRAEEHEETAYLREPVAAARGLEQARSWLEGWLGGLAQGARVVVASLGGVAPAPVVAAAGAAAGRQEVEGEGEGLRWKVVREEDGGLWVWVETEEVGVEKVVVGIGEEGAGEPVVRVEVRLVSLGGGRCGGLAFVGRWEDLGLVGRPVVVLGVVEGGVR